MGLLTAGNPWDNDRLGGESGRQSWEGLEHRRHGQSDIARAVAIAFDDRLGGRINSIIGIDALLPGHWTAAR